MPFIGAFEFEKGLLQKIEFTWEPTEIGTLHIEINKQSVLIDCIVQNVKS